jgi:partitioning defective protein 6
VSNFEDFRKIVETFHSLSGLPLTLSYSDPKDGDLFFFNNDDNYAKAIQNAKPPLRLVVQRKSNS